jgi:hypothetical protein
MATYTFGHDLPEPRVHISRDVSQTGYVAALWRSSFLGRIVNKPDFSNNIRSHIYECGY